MSDTKPAILIVQPHLGALSPFFEGPYALWRLWEHPPLEAAAAIRALLVAGEFPIDKAFAESLPNLGLIACFTSGYDGVDLEWARARGLQVTHSPGANQEEVADHAMGLIIAARRRIVDGDRLLRAGLWRPMEKTITPSLGGQKLGIVGLGAIGEALARRAEAFRMQVSWWGPNDKSDAAWPRAASLLDLARDNDILAVTARAEASNVGLISAEVIEALGPGGLLVNVARGQLVDEDAVIVALETERLGMAALDVFAEEPTPAARWANVPNTVLTPHTAGATGAAIPRMVALTLENLRRFFAGEPLANPVV